MGPKEVLKESLEIAKKLPKLAWVAAVLLPGGLTVIGAYVIVKSLRGKK